jgi:sensor histidine kinase YesM
MNPKLKIILIHVSVVAGVLVYETYFAKFFGSKAGFWDFVMFYTLNIFLFYFNALVVVKDALTKDKFILRLLPMVILEFAVYSLGFIAISFYLTRNIEAKFFKPNKEQFFFAQSLFRGGLILLYSMFYCFARYRIYQLKEKNRLELEKAQVEKEKVELQNRMLLAENALLESQIKTHLLFNTLSYVYDKTMDLPGGPGEAVLILNDVMRYSLKKVPTDGKMPINEEMEHIRNIVRLGELRHDEGLFIEIEAENVDNPEYRIIASMLSTFIENMFKYGDLKDPITPATVSARVEGDTFSFRATNKKTARSGQESHKIGLDNVRRRLQYAYDHFSLIVTDNPDEFIIDLKVPV